MFADYLLLTLFVLLSLCLLLQLYYSLFVHLRLARYPLKSATNTNQHPVSVIICARNQAHHLVKNLPEILEQDYPDFEVVVVNDCSSDDTEDVLRDFGLQYPQLKVVVVPQHDRFRRNKKFALTMGIKAAQHEHLLFTDADCRPASKKWIKEMQSGFNEPTELVLGYSVYPKQAGLLNVLLRYETFVSALNYLSFALKGKAYMGVGHNMSYLKSVFFKGKGFAEHMHIPFGDDQLFVKQHANKSNTRIEIRPTAQVMAPLYTGFGSFFKQQIRQMQVANAYKPAAQFKLSLQAASAILFYGLLITLLILGFDWRIILAFYLLRLVVQFAINFKIFKRLSLKELKWWFPILDLIHYIYILVLGIAFLFNTKTQWK